MENIKRYGPWKVQVNVELTKKYYKNVCSKYDSAGLNNVLNLEQRSFFENFGIDISKITVDRKILEECDEGVEIYDVYMMRALFCGDLYGMPEELEDFYFDTFDEEPLFISTEKSNIDFYESEDMFVDISGMAISFAHPLPYFTLLDENDNSCEEYKEWFCGKVFLKAMIVKK